MFKRLINIVPLFVHQNISIIIINIIDERVRFIDVCKTVFINIDSITISTSVFVVKRSDYELFLKEFVQRTARINFINIKNKSFKMI